MYFSAIFARSDDETGVFGVKRSGEKKGELPWKRCAEDLEWFRKNTVGATVIMGYGTWDSLGRKPLKDRRNIVVGSKPLDPDRRRHTMVVEEPFFSLICRGEKTVESRVNNNELENIVAGDTIQFEKANDRSAHCACSVTKVNCYATVQEMLDLESHQNLFPGSQDGKQAHNMLHKCNPAEKTGKGFVAFHLSPEELYNGTSRVGCLSRALALSQKIPEAKAQRKNETKGERPKQEEAKVYVIGGVGLLEEAFLHPCLNQILETRIKMQPNTAFSPSDRLTVFKTAIPRDYVVASETKGESCTWRVWIRRRENVEGLYLNLVEKVLKEGVKETDRTGVGTISTFGEQFRFNLADGFPMLTTKKVFWKGVVEELLWFLRGDTNIKPLQDAGVHIWDANLTSDHTKRLGLAPGDLGPIYGRQWRAFGPDGSVCQHGCRMAGVDQIKRVIDDIRTSPNSRRLIVSAWNPMVVDKVALPSCHCFFQFEVKNGKLSCLVYLRSNDLFLGTAFNLASYAILTHLVAEMTGLEPGTIVYTIGNAHLYLNHIEQIKEQLKRPTRMLPKLQLNKAAVQAVYPPQMAAAGGGPIFSLLKREHFQLVHYHPHPPISATMAV